MCNYNTECSLSPEEGKRLVLQLKLSEVVVLGVVEGSSLTIHFSSSLDIMQAARSVYGHSKNKVGHGLFALSLLAAILIRIFIWQFALTSVTSCQGFVGKTGTSIVKTTVKIIMEENSSQVNNGPLP